MQGNALKLILIGCAAAIYWILQSPSYELVEQTSGNYREFQNSSQGYRLQIPAEFLQPDEACPLQTSGLQLLTYFTPAAGRSSNVFFIIGSFKERDNIWGFIRRQLELLAKNEIDETRFMQEVRSSGKSELRTINGYQVYISSTENNHHFDQHVMFISNGTLVGFMLSAPVTHSRMLSDIVNSLQPL